MMRLYSSGNKGEEEFNVNDYMHSTTAADVRLGVLA